MRTECMRFSRKNLYFISHKNRKLNLRWAAFYVFWHFGLYRDAEKIKTFSHCRLVWPTQKYTSDNNRGLIEIKLCWSAHEKRSPTQSNNFFLFFLSAGWKNSASKGSIILKLGCKGRKHKKRIWTARKIVIAHFGFHGRARLNHFEWYFSSVFFFFVLSHDK